MQMRAGQKFGGQLSLALMKAVIAKINHARGRAWTAAKQ
jgi:hypothetical protein